MGLIAWKVHWDKSPINFWMMECAAELRFDDDCICHHHLKHKRHTNCRLNNFWSALLF